MTLFDVMYEQRDGKRGRVAMIVKDATGIAGALRDKLDEPVIYVVMGWENTRNDGDELWLNLDKDGTHKWFPKGICRG